jgi:hypothetical protein
MEVEFRSYLFFLFSILELLIARFGESEFGFHIDASEHLLNNPKKFIGTVSEIFETHVKKVWFESPGSIATSKELEQGEVGPEIFTSLMDPILVNTKFGGGKEIFKNYSDLMRDFLETSSDSWTLESTKVSLKTGEVQVLENHVLHKTDSQNVFDSTEDDEFPPAVLFSPKTQHLASLMIWMDILTKIESLEFPMQPEVKVDVNLLCYKPIVVFSQCLKIFGSFQNIEHPVKVLKRAQKKGLISFYATSLLTEMLRFASKLRAKLHLDENYAINGEEIEFNTFSEQERSFIEFCQTIFGRMKKSLEIMIFDGGFEKHRSWNSVMLSLSRDLILHAVQVRDIFSKFSIADGTRESTKAWNLEKEKLLNCLLPKFSDVVFQNTEFAKISPIMVDRIKGTFFMKERGGRGKEKGERRKDKGGRRKEETESGRTEEG